LSEAGGEQSALLLVPDGDRRTAQEWALVLASQGIGSRTLVRDGLLVLEVQPHRIDAARTAIARYLQENPDAPEAEVDADRDHDASSWAGLLFGIGILLTFATIGGGSSSPEIFDRANANAAKILSGQWWRCVTALCLHADIPHVLGNALIGTYLVTAVCRQLGAGLGAVLILSSGAIGNALNAIAYASGHQSVGASTAVFGAIGVLAGIAATQALPRAVSRRRRWAPFAAGLGLLAMLGTSGARVDIWAHFFGLLTGSVLGTATGHFIAVRPSRIAQWILGGLAVSVLIESWVLALE
jgi:rhomboid protease GluP